MKKRKSRNFNRIRQCNRRDFLKSTAAASALSIPAISYTRVLGSNERVNVGVVGLRGRGAEHLSGLRDYVVAVCDCDSQILAQRAGDFKRTHDRELITYVDYRELLSNDDIDAISVATPNHTHSLISIEAVKSGKHVYCEKPVSHNVWEGRQLVNAARKFGKIVQSGTQSRSSSAIKRAVQFVQSGNLGEIQYALGTCFKPRKSIGKLAHPLTIPKHIDYDLWCGPAEMRELYRPSLHYDWHWDFNTGNGDMGNQGIHQMDIARWFLGEQLLAPRVLSIGGRFGYEDAGDTPNTQTVIHIYENAPLIFETRGLPSSKQFQDSRWDSSMDNFRGSRVGVIVQCSGGHVLIPSYSEATAYDVNGVEIRTWKAASDHYLNFIEAVKANDTSLLNADILEGHISSALCHVGGVSHQVGEVTPVDSIRESTQEIPLFAESFERMLEHMTANQIDLTEDALVLGKYLDIDPLTEQVLNSPTANSMMSRDYRPGFVVDAISI
ncbi:MAG TPA: Gfo/Idh/MocA family oxidoreductase [Pirellulaceae bacterium]|nr:Gfo/Idh/MocA family oxidoreductase [Pirellulaceae bacterium]HMP70654.1 Gfo/Idh/MocA family oxidoreductase [Pirellulaceae bacterium]